MSAKRFRIAFSFAGEKRDFVEKVARILAERFGKDAILYDKYHEAEFSRSDLAFYLPDLYEKQADLVVAVFCHDYDKKEWCGLEWNAIYSLLKARNVDEVMLTRFERVEGRGLCGLAGYVDLDDLSPDQAAARILERLALNEGKSKEHYTTASLPPGNFPAFETKAKDEADVRAANVESDAPIASNPKSVEPTQPTGMPYTPRPQPINITSINQSGGITAHTVNVNSTKPLKERVLELLKSINCDLPRLVSFGQLSFTTDLSEWQVTEIRKLCAESGSKKT